MIISHKYKFIFIKTSKVGGSSIEKVIYDNFFDKKIDCWTGDPRIKHKQFNVPASLVGDFHASSKQILESKIVTEEQWQDYFKFSIERNPWDKVVSHFYWKVLKGKLKRSTLSDTQTGFKRYFKEDLNSGIKNLSDWNKYTLDGQIVMDHFVMYHNYTKGFQQMFKENLGLELSEEAIRGTKLKSGERKKYTDVIVDKHEIDKVSELCKKEIEYFGWKYGENA